MKHLVVMFGHKARTGKDTLAEMLWRESGFVRFAFADKLKEVVQDLYGFSHEQMHGDLKDVQDERYPNNHDSKFTTVRHGLSQDGLSPSYEIKNPDYKPFLTPRRILQIFGQDQRAICPDIWANYVFDPIASELFNPNVAITDMRFPNEHAVGLRWAAQDPDNRKVIAVKINRSTNGISGSNDISETALDNYENWDLEINNDGSKEELLEKFLMGVPGFDKITKI